MSDVLIKDVDLTLYAQFKQHMKKQGRSRMSYSKELFEKAMREDLKNNLKKKGLVLDKK